MPTPAYRSELDPSRINSTASTATRPRAPYSNFRQAFDSEPDRKWQVEVQKQLLQYVKMEAGWDSYQAPAVTWDASMFALSILGDVMRPRTPIPQVVPTSAGGVQLEWHEKNIDLELHITAPYKCDLWFQDHSQPEQNPIEIELSTDLSALMQPINLLTQR